MDDINEPKFKQYNNEELLRLIQSKIPENKYGEFTSLVYDIILRRSYILNLTEE